MAAEVTRSPTYRIRPLLWQNDHAAWLGRNCHLYPLADGRFQLETFTDGFPEPEVGTHDTREAARAAAEQLRLEDLRGELEEAGPTPPPEVARAGEALLALEAWQKKHYSATLELGPSVQPGDEGWVKLSAGGRTVTVSLIECDVYDEAAEETTHYGTAADAIREALRAWHADDTLKWFRVALDWEAGFEPAYPEGALVRDFGVSRFDGHCSSWVVAQFRSEAEARSWGEAAVPPEHRHFKNSPRSVSEVGEWKADWTRKYIEQTGGKG